MITLPVSDHDQETMIANILAVLARATDDQRARGLTWYRQAHALAEMISDGHVVAGAGVIAALSAQKRWPLNQRLAARAFAGDVSGHTRQTLDKVAAILDGAAPESILPMDLKTGHFYRAILDPADPDTIVIDRHAHDIATGERLGNRDRGLSSKRRYAALAHIYREAARRAGLIPSELQAITWVVHTEDRTQLPPDGE